jgi:protein-L-isoaspartate(D-aspartate) O-methyltransferase
MALSRRRVLAAAVLLLVAPAAAGPAARAEEAGHAARRERMVSRQIEARGVEDPRVLAAMRRVPRHRFVPERFRDEAYRDHPLPIGHGQTISQPYIVARMTELLRLEPGDKVLEVGTGSGYQAAVLAEVAGPVYTIEIIPELSRRAGEVLDDLGYRRVHLKVGDGYRGWPEHAPYQGIMVTAAPEKVPRPLVDQLAPGGRLVIPVGPTAGVQELLVLAKDGQGRVSRTRHGLVRFVPLVREP